MKLQLLIPQYNETEDDVKNMLDSLKVQQGVDFNDFEVLIGNDGSDIKLSEDFLKGYPYSIQYFQFEHTSPAGARQRLFDKATAEYVMFCDADDMFFSRFDQNFLKTMTEIAPLQEAAESRRLLRADAEDLGVLLPESVLSKRKRVIRPGSPRYRARPWLRPVK